MDRRCRVWSACWMLLIPFLGAIYDFLNHPHGNVYTLVTDLDRITPFVPQFIVPYLAWYGFIFLYLIWLLVKDLRLYAITLSAIVLGLIVSFSVFSVFQTNVPRPVIVGQDIFSQLIRLVYNSDNPYNAFPSIHVLTSYIVFLTSFETKVYSKILARGSQVLALLIIASTVLLKQHVLMDVAGGLLLGWVMLKFAAFAYRVLAVGEVRVWQEKPSLLSMTNMKSQS